jgi:hypothetical protein
VKYPELTFPSQFSFVDLDSKAVCIGWHSPYTNREVFQNIFRDFRLLWDLRKQMLLCDGYEFEFGQEAAIVSSCWTESTRNYGICFDDSYKNVL